MLFANSDWLLKAGTAKVLSKMAPRFATMAEEQVLAVNEAAVPENTKRAAKFGLGVFLQVRFYYS